MSYNIRCSRPVDGDNTWAQRRDGVAEVFTNHGVDLAGLQEPFEEQVADLSRRLPGYSWIGVGREDGGTAGEFNPIFYRAERLQLLEQSTFWLSPRPDLAGSVGWDARWPRIVTWARFMHTPTSRQFYLCNTHLDHAGGQAREAGAALLVEHARALDRLHPVIVTGDLNCTAKEPPYQTLTGTACGQASDNGSVLVDTLYAGVDRGNAHEPATFPADAQTGPPTRRIDYVLVSPSIRVTWTGVGLDRLADGTHPSDHLPIIADLELP